MTTVAVVRGGGEHAALDALVAAAARGIAAGGGDGFLGRPEGPDATLREAVLDADAVLLACPVVLYGMPGPMKAFLDSWLELLPEGRLVPRTANKRLGYLAVWSPDDPAPGEAFHKQVRGLCAYLGYDFRGKAAGFAPPGASLPRDENLVSVAERLGAGLAGGKGVVGYREEYLEGVRRFNLGEFWEAHEAWEEPWMEEDEPQRSFYQGLIQVAGAFHHHGNGNWGGMAALLKEGREKLLRFLPRAMGLDVEAFLAQVEPWLHLAETRAGKTRAVTRVPAELPRIDLSAEPGGGGC